MAVRGRCPGGVYTFLRRDGWSARGVCGGGGDAELRRDGCREGFPSVLGEPGARFRSLRGTTITPATRRSAQMRAFGGLGLVFAAGTSRFAVQIIGRSDSSHAAKIVLKMAIGVCLFGVCGSLLCVYTSLINNISFALVSLWLFFWRCGALCNTSLMSSSPFIFLKVEDG